MAPRTGPDGLLAVIAKTRSAALAALLAGAVLFFGGCGGSSEESSTPSSSSTSATTSSAGDSASTQAPGSESTAKDPHPSQSESKKHPSSDPSPGSHSTKHGKHVVLPKGEPEPAPTPAQRAQATVADIALSMPSLGADTGEGIALPARYTCEGENTWPTLRWNGVPAGTQELILFALAQEPVNDALFFNWAVAGIGPATTEIASGSLPTGALLGRNSYGKLGYSICPSQGKPETFIFALYALPERLDAAKGFDPASLREKVLEVSKDVGLVAVVGG